LASDKESPKIYLFIYYFIWIFNVSPLTKQEIVYLKKNVQTQSNESN
jgi:hypothetical protein